MKRILIAAVSIYCMSLTTAYADLPSSDKSSFPPVNWASKNSNDEVTIQNGSGYPLIVQITVGSAAPDAPGISLKNCGANTHVKAGSTAICYTNNANNPVSFTSDSQTDPAIGTYIIKQP